MHTLAHLFVSGSNSNIKFVYNIYIYVKVHNVMIVISVIFKNSNWKPVYVLHICKNSNCVYCSKTESKLVFLSTTSAEEACWDHKPKVLGLKPSEAILFLFWFLLIILWYF